MISNGAALFAMQMEEVFTEAGGARPLWHTITSDVDDAVREAIAWDIVITSDTTLSDRLRRDGASRAEEIICRDPVMLIGPKMFLGRSVDDIMRSVEEGGVMFISCIADGSLLSVEDMLWTRIGALGSKKGQNYVESSRTDVELVIIAEEEDAVALVTASSFAQYVESSGGEVPLVVLGDTGGYVDTVACLMSTDGYVTQRTAAADRFISWIRQGGASELAENFELGGYRPFAMR